jgi:hypothetical protein
MASHEATVAERFFSPLQVQVFPGAAKSVMSRAAALHLYRLIQQYGWCLAVDDFASRWSCFWPRLKAVERAILVYTVKTHCDGQFGRRMVVSKLPVDFEPFESDTRPAELTPEVEHEFEQLLEAYCALVAGNDKIRAWVKASCPAEYEFVERSGALDRVFGARAWVCPDQLRARCADVLRENGIGGLLAARGAARVEKALFGFYEFHGAVQ